MYAQVVNQSPALHEERDRIPSKEVQKTKGTAEISATPPPKDYTGVITVCFSLFTAPSDVPTACL